MWVRDSLLWIYWLKHTVTHSQTCMHTLLLIYANLHTHTYMHTVAISSIQSLSRVQLCDPKNRSRPALPVHHQFPELTQNHVHWVSYGYNHLILCLPFFPSIRIFSNESVLPMRWPNYWSFSFSISPSNEYSGLISFRMYWLDLLAVQWTLNSLLQHHSSKASILWCSAFFIVQLSHPYMTTGKSLCWYFTFPNFHIFLRLYFKNVTFICFFFIPVSLD